MAEPPIGILNFDRAAVSRHIARACVAALHRRGWSARVMGWGHGLTLDPAARDCRGLIAFAYDDQECAAHLKELGLPVVGTAYPIAGVPRVVTDDRATGVLAAEELLRRGLRRFAFFGSAGLDFSDRKQQGFTTRLRRQGIHADCFTEHWRLRLTAGQAEYDRLISAWLQALPRPCGILASLDENAVYLAQLCHRLGLRVPEDLALLGSSGDDDACAMAQPPISTIAHPSEGIAEAAVALLADLLAGRPVPNDEILLPPLTMTARRSTDLHLIDDPVVAKALALISARAADGLEVDDVVADLPVSRRELERRFRRLLGRTPKDEIERARIELAKRLLLSRNVTLDHVARSSGFASARRLADAFRRALGTDPTSWRRDAGAGP